VAKISDKKIREIILEEVSRALLPESTIQDLGDLKSQARVINPKHLRPSKEAYRLIKKHEGFRERVYDDKKDTEEGTGPWIVSFGYDPITGVPIGPDRLSGRLGGDKFDITNFSDTVRMSKTNGVPTVGYGFALNTSDKLRKWAKHLGGEGLYSEPQFGLGGDPFGSQDFIPGEIASTSLARRDMTRAEADQLLEDMLPEYYIPIKRRLKAWITQDQFDALVSRAWNEGAAGKTIIAAVDLLNLDNAQTWTMAGRAGRFNEEGRRQQAERAKMLSWSTEIA
jgi:GH24 family phage-related lysozyme (muramidase)